MEPVASSPRLAMYRSAALAAFPKKDKLPVVVWGNGGCALDGESFGGYLETIASHGYLAVTTAAPDGANSPRATADDLALKRADCELAITWTLQKVGKRSFSGRVQTID